jgi:hypothetical protein
MLWREYQLGLRGPAFWAMAGVGALVGVWRAGAPGTSAALAAYGVWHTVVLGVGVLALLLAGAAAARDRRQAAVELVLAKPAGSSPELVALRFLGVWLSVMTAAAVMLAASSLGQVILGRTPWHFSPYLVALLLCALPIGLACALGFFLSSAFTPVASAVAAIYWVALPLARLHIPTVLDLTLSQHWLVSLLVTAGLVTLAAALYARPVRGRSRSGSRLAWGAVVLFCAAGLAALAIVSQGDDGLLEPNAVLAAISAQTKYGSQRAPGFWLPGRGGLVVLGDFAGRPVALAFWSPAVPSSAGALDVLARACHGTDVSYIAVCVDRDAATMPLFARGLRKDVVLAWDRGQHFGRGIEWSDSPLAVAYDVAEVPAVFLLDREHRLVNSWSGELDAEALRSALSSRAVGK